MRTSTKIYAVWCLLFIFPLFQCIAQSEDQGFLQKGTTFFGLNQAVNIDILDYGTFLNLNPSFNKGFSDRFGIGAQLVAGANLFNSLSYAVFLNGAYVWQPGTRQWLLLPQLGYSHFNSDLDVVHAGIRFAHPLQLKKSRIYFMPNIAYRYRLDNGSVQDFHTHTVSLEAELYASIPKGGWFKKELGNDSGTRYQVGTQMWGQATKIVLSKSDNRTNLISGEIISRSNYTFDFNANYAYYVIDNFAVGMEAGVGLNYQPSQNGSSKTTSSSIRFDPYVRWHPLHDGRLNNIYLECGGGYNASKTEFESNKFRSRVTRAHAGLGMFMGLSTNVYLTPSAHYRWRSAKDPDSVEGIKTTQESVRLALELSYLF